MSGREHKDFPHKVHAVVPQAVAVQIKLLREDAPRTDQTGEEETRDHEESHTHGPEARVSSQHSAGALTSFTNYVNQVVCSAPGTKLHQLREPRFETPGGAAATARLQQIEVPRFQISKETVQEHRKFLFAFLEDVARDNEDDVASAHGTGGAGGGGTTTTAQPKQFLSNNAKQRIQKCAYEHTVKLIRRELPDTTTNEQRIKAYLGDSGNDFLLAVEAYLAGLNPRDADAIRCQLFSCKNLGGGDRCLSERKEEESGARIAALVETGAFVGLYQALTQVEVVDPRLTASTASITWLVRKMVAERNDGKMARVPVVPQYQQLQSWNAADHIISDSPPRAPPNVPPPRAPAPPPNEEEAPATASRRRGAKKESTKSVWTQVTQADLVMLPPAVSPSVRGGPRRGGTKSTPAPTVLESQISFAGPPPAEPPAMQHRAGPSPAEPPAVQHRRGAEPPAVQHLPVAVDTQKGQEPPPPVSLTRNITSSSTTTAAMIVPIDHTVLLTRPHDPRHDLSGCGGGPAALLLASPAISEEQVPEECKPKKAKKKSSGLTRKAQRRQDEEDFRLLEAAATLAAMERRLLLGPGDGVVPSNN